MTSRDGENGTPGPRSVEADDSALRTCGRLSGHRKANGELCECPILTHASGLTACYMSSVPEDIKLAAVSKGGSVTARVVRNPTAVNPSLRMMPQILAYIEETGGQLARGEITERGSNARMQIADKAIRAHSENLADRLTELEELVAKRARSVGWRRP